MKHLCETERRAIKYITGPKWVFCALGLAMLAAVQTSYAADSPARLKKKTSSGAITSSTAGARLDRAATFRRVAESGEKTWAAALEPEKYNPGMSAFFTYALALCEAKMHPERLEKLMERACQLQDRDPKSPDYGSFRWNWNDKKVGDQNAIEFNMQPAAILWLRHRDSMPPAAREKLRAILDPAVIAALRHHVRAGYTNIALIERRQPDRARRGLEPAGGGRRGLPAAARDRRSYGQNRHRGVPQPHLLRRGSERTAIDGRVHSATVGPKAGPRAARVRVDGNRREFLVGQSAALRTAQPRL